MTALDALGREECGILLSLSVLGAEDAILKRLGGERFEACARGWQALQEAGREFRTQVLAEWRGEAALAAPRGLERLHPSWIEASLSGEPSHVLEAILAGAQLPESVHEVVRACLPPGSNSVSASGAKAHLVLELSELSKVGRAEIARDVARMAFGWLAPLLDNSNGPLAEELCALSFDDLLEEVRRHGARALGGLLAGTTPAVRARVMASLGEPWASVILASSLQAPSKEEHALAVTCATTAALSWVRSPRERLLSIGLAVLKAKLAAEDSGSPFRVAGRLPCPLGLAVAGELEQHGHGLLVAGAVRPDADLG
jgi:hypothetical protein